MFLYIAKQYLHKFNVTHAFSAHHFDGIMLKIV